MKYFIIAGERSGDEYASYLINAIRSQDEQAKFIGYGGAYMAQSGANILKDYLTFTTHGLRDVLLKLPFYHRLFQECLAAIKQEKPDFLILVDFPGLNLKVAESAAGYGKLVYFISPKVWAWGRSRISILRTKVDLLLSIFPFETKYFRRYGLNQVVYIGNPTKWTVSRYLDNQVPLAINSRWKRTITCLPGSRSIEVKNHIGVIRKLAQSNKDTLFYVSVVEGIPTTLYHSLQRLKNVDLFYGNSFSFVKRSDVVIVASGTATLEVALLGKPQIVIYKTNWLTYLAARLMVKLNYISLVNILVDREVVNELIQWKCTVSNLEKEILRLSIPENQKKISEGYSEILDILGDLDPFEKGAHEVLKLRQP